MRKKVLCIIPARSNSKGIPSKNIQKVFGRPLIEYTINTAKKSRLVTRIIVSTDSQEIANVALKLGAEVPFIRPADISEDVGTELVLKHALNYLENVKFIAILVII